MDDKHAMLYPTLEQSSSTMQRDQRMSASVAIGLPIEPPPSYDAAMSDPTNTSPNATTHIWMPSAPESSGGNTRDRTRDSVIVEEFIQPGIVPALPPQQPQQQQHNSNSNQPQINTVPQATVVNTPPKLGPNPCAVPCPACGACKTTRMSYTSNTRTHLCALLLCLVGWCCCACWVPYCMKSCRTGNHYCAKCNTFLGSFNAREHK